MRLAKQRILIFYFLLEVIQLDRQREVFALLGFLGLIAIFGIIGGIILALSGYSSSGAFSVSAACVGVLGTLVAQRYRNGTNDKSETASAERPNAAPER